MVHDDFGAMLEQLLVVEKSPGFAPDKLSAPKLPILAPELVTGIERSGVAKLPVIVEANVVDGGPVTVQLGAESVTVGFIPGEDTLKTKGEACAIQPASSDATATEILRFEDFIGRIGILSERGEGLSCIGSHSFRNAAP